MPDLDGSYRHETPLVCPHCGAELDGTTNVIEGEGRPISERTDDAKPTVGSYGVCIKCSGIQVYGETDGVGYLRKPTEEEEKEANAIPLLRRSQEAVLAMKYRAGEDPGDLSSDPDLVPEDAWDFKVTFVVKEDASISTYMKARVPKIIAIELLEALVKSMKEDVE